jgi:hypothetical protein
MSDEIPMAYATFWSECAVHKSSEDFAKLDVLRLARFSDKDLAEWQSKQQTWYDAVMRG